MKRTKALLVITCIYILAFVVGALLVLLLFNCISIPMMEKRQLKRRPDYESYRKETSRLLLLPRRAK